MADNQNTSSIQKGGSAGTKKQDELSEANDFVLADQATVKPETDGVGVLFGAEAEFENNDGEAEVGNSAADADGVDALDSAPEAAENTVVNQPKPSQDVDAQSSEGSGQTSLNVSNGEVSGGDARVEDVALNENQQAAGVNVIDAEGVENNDAAIEGGASGPTSQQSGPQASEFNNESEEANVELSLTVEDLPENATPGTLVATIDTTGSSDTGPFTFELTGPDAALFTIVGNEIFVAEGASIDFETLSTLNFSVTVSDVTGATATEDASVEILDVNEAPTEVTWTAFNLAEDAAAGTAVGSIAVADEDAGDSHSFELSGEGSENFSIVDGQVVVAEGVTLDHETNPTFNLSLKVTDEGGLETSRPITINVADVNEGPTDINLTANTVNENDAGAVVGTLSTTDVDDGQSHTYTVSDSRFEVVDGDLKLKDGVSLDHETEDSVTVTVTTDDGNGGTFNEDFTINVADVNEFAVTAVADNDSDANTISEAASNGDTVGITAFAEDLDATTSDVTYSLSDDADGAFTIDSDTGVVTVLDASKISFEDGDTRDIEVTATSADGSTSVQSYTINVTDTAESINVSGTFVDTGVAETQITGSDTADNITLHETGGNVRGGDGNDTLEGSVANDVLRGDDGNDTVIGGAGNDQIFGGAGADVLDGGEGIDTARYDADSIGINVNLETGEASGGEAEGDSFASIENVWGGSADDVITGSSGNNSLRGLDGDDVIDGGAGNDVLRGDEGNDTVVGGAGNDQIFGGAGADVLDGGEGVDTLRYEEDIEGVTLNLQTNTVSGGEAEGDTISNFENAYGGSADDVITGSSGNNTLRGRAGDDTIYGGDGNDSVFGDGGRDVLDGGDGIDTLRFDFDSAGVNVNLETGITSGGEAEGDTISNFENVFGGSGNDVLTGDDGRNVLRGNDGADTITGGAGNDILTGGAGDDAISGGSGTDTANFSGNWSDYTITENNGTYTIVDNRDGSPDGTDTVTDVENFQFADGTVGVADLVNSGPSDISLSANAVTENDTGAVVGTLTTTDGDVLDSHTYTVSDSRFEVVDGDLKLKDDQSLSFEDGDTVTVTVTTTDNAGASYNEDFNITVSDVTESINVSGTFVDTGVAETDITGSSGVDIITAHDDGSNIDGGDNYDTLIGGAGNDTFDGGLHNDTLSGSGGDDTLFGNHGADIITGGAGDDNIDGGTDTVGDDVAIYSGNWSDYTITEDSGTYTIVDNRDGSPDGTDTVTNIESFQFADGTVGVADLLNVGPTDISADSTSVDENATAGTVVANLSATDGDVLDNHTYEITGGASDLFEISGDQIVVKSGADLNFEGQTSHDVTVQVTDAHGASYSETVTINVNDQAEDIQLGDAGVTYTEVSVTETRVLGGDGDDTITGGDGDDTFGGGMGHDTLNGGDGDDALFGNWNNDTVDGGAGDDHIDGGADHDTLFGGEGNDTLEGGYSGNDIIEGGAGNDTIDGGGVGVGIVGGDNDTAVYSGNWSDYTITENNGTYTIVDNRDGSPDGTDTVTDVENFQFADGTVGVADLVNSGPSDISLSTNAVTENDTGAVVGTLTTTDGDALDSHTYTVSDSRFEVVDGDLKLKDDQSLSFEDGDTVTVTVTTTDSAGASYNEDFNITVSDVTESINVSGTFVDTGVAETDIAGSSGADVITAHDDGGKITGDDGDDTLIGGAGDDDLRGNNGEDDISGGAGNDILRGGDGDDIVSGGTGDDHIFGEAGADTLDGGDGVDTLRYNSDTDGLNVNLTDNTVTGAGSDGDTISNFENIQTGSGDDTLIGSSADNTLQSNDGDDTLEGRGGDDAIRGGDGNDTAVYSGNWSDYTITVNASDTYTVVDNRPGSPDGTDTVRDVENFQFADGIVPLADLLNTGPTDIDLSNSSVDENAAGAVVGELSTTDSNALDSHSYTVSDSRFEVVDGDLKLKDGVSLDHETEDTVSVMVTTTDSFGESFNEDFTINVADVNEGPIDLSITSATTSGIALNNDGGTSALLETTDGGDIVGGLTQLTLEVTFSSTEPDNGYFFSYSVPGQANEVLFGINTADNLVLFVNGTGVAIPQSAIIGLFDGEEHQLSVTWDSADGAVAFYADGEILGSTTGFATGETIGEDGILVLGQDQDNFGGGFQASQAFEGVLHDLRVFDDVRTSQEISDNTGTTLTGSEDGLVANFQFDNLEGGVTTDIVSGHTLTLDHATGGGFTTSTPELVVSVEENATDGTVVATISAVDNDEGDTVSFSLVDDAGGRFTIDETTGVVTVADGSLLNFEADQSHDIIVQVEDNGGLTYQETVTIDLGDVNEGPTDIDLTANTVNENDAGAVVGTLSTTDVDDGQSHSYTVSDSRFEVVDGDLKLKDGVSLDHETEDSVTVTVTTDDGNGGTFDEDFTINVADVNEGPTVTGESVSVELPQDVFYFTGNSNFGMLDPSTGEVTILGDTNGVSYGDVAVTADGTLFGTTFGSGELHRLDSATGDVLEVVTTDLPNNLNALVAAPDGTLYATDASSNQFFSIDADTGASTLVGNIGSSTSGGDLAFVDGELYLATGQSTIVRLDLDQIDGSNTIASEVIVPNSGGVTFFGLTSNGDGELYATDSDSNLYQVDIEGGTTTFISDLSSSISGSVYGAAAQSETSGFVEGNVLTNDSDVDGDALSITSFEFDGSSFTAGTEVPGEYGTFTLNSDGSYSYNVDENNAATLALGEGEQGTETFTYTVSDGNGGTAQATITVDVQGQNEGPTAISLSSTSVTESDAGAVVGTLSTTDVDASDTHTYTVSDSRFEVVDGDLKLKDDQNLDFETEQSVTVTVTTTDSTGASYNEDFTINVTDVAESINVSGTFLDTGVAETEISGSSGDDRIGANEDGGSVVYGLGGNDTLVGGAGNDDLRGGGGDDIINAGAGDDVVNVGNGDDVADGGDGTDTLLVGNADINIVNLDTGVYTKEFDNGDVDTNTISNFENVDLSSATGNNEVTGDSNDNVITGGSGNDTISGGDSNDTLLGGEGNDVLHGDAPAVSRIIDLEFEESSGTSAADSSGNSHTGTYVNGATAGGTTRDGGGNAAVLDGIDDYIEVAAHSDFAVDQGTISLWFNPDNLDDPQSALFSRDSSNFDGGGHITGWARSDGSVEIRIQSDTQSFHLRSDPNSIEAGEWNHVSFSFGPDGAKLYIDGTEAASNDTTIGITGNNEPWTVGASQTVSGDGTADNLREYFDGAIDDFSIVDRQLTAEEVVTVKDNGAAALEDTSGAGNDILDGGDGNDTLHGGAGNDTLYGGLGTDVAEFGGDVGDYSIDTSGGIITVADNNIADGDDGVDTLSGVETLRFNGTDYDISSFVTSGTASADVIIGSEGNDVPSGSFGDDIIFGGRGDDQVRGGEGADELHGGSGSDTLLYDTDTVGVTVNLATGAASGGDATGDTFTSFENVVGGLGNDDLTGDANDNTIWGRDGDDVIDGGAGNDRIYGEGGADAIDGGDGIDLVLYDHDTTGVTVNLETGTGSGGEAEGDTFDNIENVLGGHGDDTITGDSNNNVLWGRDGMDVINGGAGDDVLYGDGGNDTLSGGAGNDTLFGGDGDDILTSGTGADTIDGGDGSDTIQLHAVVGQGGVSNSIQDTGTDGTDTLEFVGGSGSSFDVQANFSAETSGIEIIDGTQATGEVLQANGLALDFDLTDVTLVGVDQIRGSGSDDTVIGSGGDDYITGGSGNDTLTGGLGDDLLEGGDGNDIFKIGLADGNDTIYGGSGGIYEDVIQLNGVTQEGLDNGSWTIALDNGTIESQADGQLDLSDDASGTITLQDGTSIDFYEIEQIQW